jgi:hypothetical protein
MFVFFAGVRIGGEGPSKQTAPMQKENPHPTHTHGQADRAACAGGAEAASVTHRAGGVPTSQGYGLRSAGVCATAGVRLSGGRGGNLAHQRAATRGNSTIWSGRVGMLAVCAERNTATPTAKQGSFTWPSASRDICDCARPAFFASVACETPFLRNSRTIWGQSIAGTRSFSSFCITLSLCEIGKHSQIFLQKCAP